MKGRYSGYSMENIEKLLSVGDLRSAGNSEKVVKMVLANPDLFDEVVNAIFSDNPGTRMRASDAVEKITRDYPEYLKPHKRTFLNKIAKIEQKEVRWHVAQILPRLSLTSKEKDKVYNLMMDFINDKSSIVRTFAMQALTDIAMQDNKYTKKVKRLIIDLMKTGSPAMKTRGKKLIGLLEKAES